MFNYAYCLNSALKKIAKVINIDHYVCILSGKKEKKLTQFTVIFTWDQYFIILQTPKSVTKFV